jgi:hypothetical protein
MTHQEVDIERIRQQQHVRGLRWGLELSWLISSETGLSRRTAQQLDHGFEMRDGAELVGQVHVGRLLKIIWWAKKASVLIGKIHGSAT